MFALRTVIEEPFPGGERFLAVIGPSRALRRSTRVLLVTAVATGGLALAPTVGGLPWLAASLASLVLFVIGRWIGGGIETLLCERAMLVHRQGGALGNRRRSLSTEDLIRIRIASSGGASAAIRGIRIEWRRQRWTVGRFLESGPRRRLAQALQRHLSSPEPDPLAALSFPRRPRLRAPARITRDAVLLFRNPPPRS